MKATVIRNTYIIYTSYTTLDIVVMDADRTFRSSPLANWTQAGAQSSVSHPVLSRTPAAVSANGAVVVTVTSESRILEGGE